MKKNKTTYRVNEIFLSVQAEGRNSGRPAVFVRFSGCNLACPWCDTNHKPHTEMTAAEIDREIRKLTRGNKRFIIVFTGGEPTLQLKNDEEIGHGYERCCESNGTLKAPNWIRWVTVSPKTHLSRKHLKDISVQELKFVYTGKECEKELAYYGKVFDGFLYVQPLEKKGKMNVKDCIDFVHRHPNWRLSVQWHKLTGVR